MAQTKKAADKQQNKQQENNQSEQNKQQDNNQADVNLQAEEQTQTPSSRQAGANQPQQSQQLTRDGQNRGVSSGGQYSSMNPFSFMSRFSQEMDRLFDDFGFGGGLMSSDFGGGFDQLMTSDFSPQTEVFRRGNDLVVQADLPGMSKDDINVDIENDRIIIRGERQSENERSEEGSFYTERSYGSFYRSIPLPEGVDLDAAKANFNNGVLEVTMPLPQQKSGGRSLEIGEGNQQDAKQQKNNKTEQKSGE